MQVHAVLVLRDGHASSASCEKQVYALSIYCITPLVPAKRSQLLGKKTTARSERRRPKLETFLGITILVKKGKKVRIHGRLVLEATESTRQ